MRETRIRKKRERTGKRIAAENLRADYMCRIRGTYANVRLVMFPPKFRRARRERKKNRDERK